MQPMSSNKPVVQLVARIVGGVPDVHGAYLQVPQMVDEAAQIEEGLIERMWEECQGQAHDHLLVQVEDQTRDVDKALDGRG